MICFLCKRKFCNKKLFFRHFRVDHFLKSNDCYHCCGQIYSNSKSFQRHVQKRHDDSITSESYTNAAILQTRELKNVECSKIITFVENSTVPENTEISDSNLSNNSENESNEKMFIRLQESVLKLLTNMHSNFNFSRKDVTFIFSTLIGGVLEPLFDILNAFRKDLDNVLSTKLTMLLSKCSEIFEKLKTEYLFYKNL